MEKKKFIQTQDLTGSAVLDWIVEREKKRMKSFRESLEQERERLRTLISNDGDQKNE